MHRLQQLRARATRPRRTVPVLLDGELREQIEAAEDALDRLDDLPVKDKRLATKSTGAKLREDLATLRASAEESTLYVVLEGMQRTAYRALFAANQATATDGTTKLDRETFTPALVKACVVGYRERPDADAPVLTDWSSDDYVAWLVDEFVSPGQLDKLSTAAFELCTGDDAVPLPHTRSPIPSSDGE